MKPKIQLFEMHKLPVNSKSVERKDAFKAKKGVPVLAMVNWDTVTCSILANQVALYYNEKMKHTGYAKHNLKKYANLLIPELIKAEINEYDKCYDAEEKVTSMHYDIMDETIKAMGSIHITQFPGLTEVIKAFGENPKSMLGIAKKINRK